MKQGKIFVFSAASGAGKTTLLNYLLEKYSDLVYSVSATTRKPRPNEKNGVNYFFITEDEFKEKIQKGEFAEWAIVHGNYYGTLKSFIDKTIQSGKHIVMDIDVIGKKKFDQIYPQAIGILILPPSLDVLRERLYNRKTDDEETIRLRLANAVKEIEFAQKEGKYEYTVVNDDLEVAKKQLDEIIQKEISKIK
jgi:guanylate kinase